MKYYGTTVNSLKIPQEIKDKFGLENRHHQYRLVIKAKSMAAANRRWNEVTNTNRNVFNKDYTSVTGNQNEIEACDQYGEIIGNLNRYQDYVDLKEVISEIQTFKQSETRRE